VHILTIMRQLGLTLIRSPHRCGRVRQSPLLVPDHSLCKDGYVNPATLCQRSICDPSIHVSKKLLKRGSIVHEEVDAVVKGNQNHPIDNVPELAPAPFNQSCRNHCHVVINRHHSVPIPPHPLNHPNCCFHRNVISMTNI
jgi:hypothetical protein